MHQFLIILNVSYFLCDGELPCMSKVRYLEVHKERDVENKQQCE